MMQERNRIIREAARQLSLLQGIPFGQAIRPIEPGQYVCNNNMLRELRSRHLPFALPADANFDDTIPAFSGEYRLAAPLERVAQPDSFLGYMREGGRGAGTRNHIVLLAMTALSSGFVQQVEEQFKEAISDYAQVDGVVAVAHTEGRSARRTPRRP